MNRGPKKRKAKQKNLDELVDKINAKIGYLLGKKPIVGRRKKVLPEKTNNLTFVIITILSLGFLWVMTGFYYLANNQHGLILRNGKIFKEVKGLSFGLMAPYPFDYLETIDGSVVESINIGKFTLNDSEFVALAKTLEPIVISATFSYQVIESKKLYLNFYEDNKELSKLLKWKVSQKLHQYVAAKTKNELISANLIVTANELRQIINQDLAIYGVKLIKLDVNSLHLQQNSLTDQVLVETNPPSKLAIKLISQAENYHQNQIALTKVEIEKYKQLLPQYHSNPQAIIQQLYYDMLETVPMVQKNQYELLNFNLTDLMLIDNPVTIPNTVLNQQEIKLKGRNFSREVVREREFDR